MKTHAASLDDLSPLLTTTPVPQVLAFINRLRAVSGYDMPEIFDSLLQSLDGHLHDVPRESRPRVRADHNGRLTALLMQLYPRVRPPLTSNAIIGVSSPTPLILMIFNVAESSGYGTLPVPLADLTYLADIVRHSQDARYVIFEGGTPGPSGSPAQIKKAVGMLREVCPSIRFIMMVPAGSAGDALAIDGVASVSSLRQLADIMIAGRVSPLTDREAQVLRLVSLGHTNSQIAEELGVSTSTVKTHLIRVHSKLDVVDRASAVASALRRGWIS